MIMEYVRILGLVEHFPYRTASIRDRFLSIPRSQTAELEERLAEAAGVGRDNHTAYGITTDAGTKMYIMFSDFDTAFGHSIEVRNW